MKKIGWGRRLRTALRTEGFTRINKAEILSGLRACAADLGSQAADIFWKGAHGRPDIPQPVLDDAALSISGEVDTAIHSILKEWRIPRSSESERLAEVAESAFKERLAALISTAGQGGAV